MPTVTTQAEAILSALETTPGLREELETYFSKRWNVATGLESVRESLEARIADLEDQREDEGVEYDDLRRASRRLCDAIGDADRKDGIPSLVKTLKSLL